MEPERVCRDRHTGERHLEKLNQQLLQVWHKLLDALEGNRKARIKLLAPYYIRLPSV